MHSYIRDNEATGENWILNVFKLNADVAAEESGMTESFSVGNK